MGNNNRLSDSNRQNEGRMIKLSETGFMRLSDVLSLIPLSKTTWYSGIAEGRFPSPVRLSQRTSAWKVEDIRKLIDELGQDAQ